MHSVTTASSSGLLSFRATLSVNVIITTKPKVGGVQGWLAELEKVHYWLFGGCSRKHSLLLLRRRKMVSAE